MIQWSPEVLVWWISLSLIGVLNIAFWLRTAKKGVSDPERKTQLWLSFAFVIGCASRSFIPRADVQRWVLWDSWISSVFVGRSIATIAELSFMAQLSIFLRELAKATGQKTALRISYVIVPLIAMAECFSWYAVISTNYLGNTMEESTWTLSASLLIVGFFLVQKRLQPRLITYARAGMLLGLGYIVFMTRVDVPMYFGRWRADEAAGRAYLSLATGLHDVSSRWVVTRSIGDWRTEIPWMTLYFSAAVWLSLSLISAPKAALSSER